MTLDSGFVEHIIDLMHDLGGVSARRMFGGYGLYRRGVMFALVFDDVLYLKVDQINRPDFIAAGMEPFTYEHTSGKPVEMPYWQAPADLFDDAAAMVEWADQ
ncbi:MAG TPA: TfoX/Sxy family protein, partial [Alphaproteobacteria bacterium]|nr:TfoX/Sxy family protein [Alphaproteobacteria bacterium]